eukprot:GHRR01019930.1.p1 GENE.GHRR01019930.1~~GHRR01019930.1.p1  ORF type:complete len:228 (+),score=47.01 GHRR01019930.1:212-895(+)
MHLQSTAGRLVGGNAAKPLPPYPVRTDAKVHLASSSRHLRQVLQVCRDSILMGEPAPVTATQPEVSVPPCSRLHHTTEMQQVQQLVGRPVLSELPSGLYGLPVMVAGHEVPAASTAVLAPDTAPVDLDALNPNYNKSGLNGLSVGGTTGLQTGHFTVSAQMPVLYNVQEVPRIFDLSNKHLLRGVVPGSFPFALGPEPEVTTGMRRLIVIDENVERLYGDKLRQVCE